MPDSSSTSSSTSSSSKKRALAFNEGPHNSQSARLTRRVSSGPSVYPPSLIVWENAVDGVNDNNNNNINHNNNNNNGNNNYNNNTNISDNSNNGANSVGKGQSRQGSNVRHSTSLMGMGIGSNGCCSNTMCGIPKGSQPGTNVTVVSGNINLNGLKDISDPVQCKNQNSSLPSNSTEKASHEINDEFLWKKKKQKKSEVKNDINNINIEQSTDDTCNDDEGNESDSSLLFTPNCVQSVTTILVDEGDMNPLKVRTSHCTVVYCTVL